MNLIDKISSWPDWAKYTVGAAVFALFGVLFWMGMGLGGGKASAQETEPVFAGIPDAEEDRYEKTRLQEFREGSYRNGVDDYWDSLADDGFGLSGGQQTASPEALDPSVYSELERYYIQNGIKTKAEIDADHARKAAEEEAFRQRMAGGSQPAQPRMTQAQQDSLYFARIEQAYAIAAKYSAPQAQPEAAAEEPEEVDKHIDISPAGGVPEPSTIPTDAFVDDGIISSLGEPAANGIVHYAGTRRSVPVKATFLKTEKLTSGQRVIIRLMQDMMLSDGTLIPANTHINGICSIGRRLKVNITMLHYNGKMFPTDISIYDNDGTEGIYCPMAEEASGRGRKAKKVATDVASGAAGIAGTFFSGNILMGSAARSSVQQVTSSLNSDGSMSVSVSSGYEFYVFENIKQN